jgi:hypothetical protein
MNWSLLIGVSVVFPACSLLSSCQSLETFPGGHAGGDRRCNVTPVLNPSRVLSGIKIANNSDDKLEISIHGQGLLNLLEPDGDILTPELSDAVGAPEVIDAHSQKIVEFSEVEAWSGGVRIKFDNQVFCLSKGSQGPWRIQGPFYYSWRNYGSRKWSVSSFNCDVFIE